MSLHALSPHQHCFLQVANGILASFLNGLSMLMDTRKPFPPAQLPTLGIHLLPTTPPPKVTSQRPSGTDLLLSSLSSTTSPSISSLVLDKFGVQEPAPAARSLPAHHQMAVMVMVMGMEVHLPHLEAMAAVPQALAALPRLRLSSLLHQMAKLVSLKISFSTSFQPILPK